MTLWWRDWREHVLGVLKQSHNILVLKSNRTLGGKRFTCVAAHPLRSKAAECHVQLGKCTSLYFKGLVFKRISRVACTYACAIEL